MVQLSSDVPDTSTITVKGTSANAVEIRNGRPSDARLWPMSFRSLAVLLLGVGVLTAACGRSSRNRTRATETGEGGEPNVGADNAGARSSVSGSASSGGVAGQASVGDAVECGSGPLVKCTRHSQCGSNEACLCTPGNDAHCVPANCRTDDDCSDGVCVQTITGVGCVPSEFVVGLYCTTSKDTCDGRSPSGGTCEADKVCRYSLDEGAYLCHPRCAG